MITRVVLIAVTLASGCIAVAPPKTPNQRAAERAAPKVDVPPPQPPEAPPRAARSPGM